MLPNINTHYRYFQYTTRFIKHMKTNSYQQIFYCQQLIPSTCHQLMKFCVSRHDCVCKMIGHHQLYVVLIAQVSPHVSESCCCCTRDCRHRHDLADSEIPSQQARLCRIHILRVCKIKFPIFIPCVTGVKCNCVKFESGLGIHFM